MVDCPDRPCPVCKGPMTGRQKSACSVPCRAEASRRRKAEVQAERDQRVQRLVEALAREVGLRGEESA